MVLELLVLGQCLFSLNPSVFITKVPLAVTRLLGHISRLEILKVAIALALTE